MSGAPKVYGMLTKLVATGSKVGMVYALERESGSLMWMRELGPGSESGDLGILNNTTWSGKNLLVALNTGARGVKSATLYALDGGTGDTLWEKPLVGDVLGRITVAGGVGFVGVGSRLEVFDVDNGKTIASLSTGGSTAAGVASIADGLVAFGTGADALSNHTASDGRLIVLEVER